MLAAWPGSPHAVSRKTSAWCITSTAMPRITTSAIWSSRNRRPRPREKDHDQPRGPGSHPARRPAPGPRAAASSREQPAVDPQLAAAIAGIKAIDNHAHPVLAAPGDREFDALPVDHMEPQSDPVAMRPGAFQTPFTAESKAAAKRQRGDGYPAWVLEQMGVETMLANRVAMGTSVQPPRFRWVPY